MAIRKGGELMALSQTQIIQSLGEALAWFEKELVWGVDPAELRHLTGRIGELYAAMTTRGQMALANNQRGYDVVSADNERVSVKTVTSSNHVTFRKSTITEVDRIIVLRINIEESEVSIEELADQRVEEFLARCQHLPAEYRFPVRAKTAPRITKDHVAVAAKAVSGAIEIVQYESGTIEVTIDGSLQPAAIPVLRSLAVDYGVDLLNGAGGVRNTRQLGAAVICAINAIKPPAL